MALSALFLLAMGVGALLVYDAVKGSHPWSDFQSVLGSSSTTTTKAAG